MANFITGPELQTAITTNLYNGITDGGDATVLAQLLNFADAQTFSALRRSGYSGVTVASLSTMSTADQYIIKAMAIRLAYAMGCGRKSIQIPDSSPWVLASDFYSSRVRLPDTAPTFDGAPGGIIISDSGTEADATTNRGTVFGMDKTGGYP